MEYRDEKSIPVVKEFQLESSWGPWTPIRPSPARPIAFYEEGQNGLFNQPMLRESEDFLSRFSQINQTQTLLSGSISCMERNMQNTPNFDDIWDRGNVELQRRGLEGYLPRWDSQERRTIHNYGSMNQSSSNYPCLNSMDSPLSWRNNGVRENVGMLRHLSDDPFGQFDNMSFGDLLGMKCSVLEPSLESTRFGDSLFLGSSSTFGNQESLQDLNQHFNGVFGQEMENSASIHQKWKVSNVDSTPLNKHTVGSSTLAPPTPDLLWRSRSSPMSENASVRTPEKPNEQNRSHENEATVEFINLHDLNSKEVVTEAASDSRGQVSGGQAENHSRDKGDLDLNKTPQKKPRRKRYMPKVVNENKPKRTPNPKTPKARDSKEPRKPKSTYVRKSKQTPTATSSPNGEAAKTIDPKKTKPAAKSCRKALKFDLNGQVTEDNSMHKPDGGLNAETRAQPNDLNYTLNQELKKYMALPEEHDWETLNSNSSPCASSNEGVQTRGSKRAHYVGAENGAFDHGKFGQPANSILYNANIHEITGIGFPESCKKRRTDNGQRSLTSNMSCSANVQAGDAQNQSKYYYSDSVPFGSDAVTNNQVEMLMRGQLLNTWLDISRLKKKRTKSTTRVRDLASLQGIASVSQLKSALKGTRRRNNAVSDSHYIGNSSYINQSDTGFACIEALTEEVHGTTRWKRSNRKGKSVAQSTSSKSNQRWDLVLYDGNQTMKNRRGRTAKAPLIKTATLEAITEGLKLLNINKKGRKVSSRERNALVPYRGKNTGQNVLVPYGNDGTLVPYEGPFDPIRKRRQRARVDLDDETTRVWRLLLENIDNEGIDGTDEEKAKWWENERGVFRGRVDSFIARMRLVQGDRRFTPWKGSVLDSVIGVFLTQNVSDHLSSSAFMCLAARFPIKSDSCESTLSEGSSTLVVEQGVCVTEPEESITWNEKSPDIPVCDWKSRVIYSLEEKEVVDGKEIIGGVCGSISYVNHSSESSQGNANESRAEIEVAARDDVTSSQQSVISSQNSADSLSFHTGGVMNTFLESNSKCHFNHSTSFLGLLKMAESPFLDDSFGQLFDQDRSEVLKHVGNDSLEVPGITPSGYQLYQKSDFHMKATTGFGMTEVESITPDVLKKDEVSTTKQSIVTPRSSPENVSSCYVLEGQEMIMQSQTGLRNDSPECMASSQQQRSSIRKGPNVQNSLKGTTDVTASTTSLGRANNKKEAENIPKNNHASSGTSDITNADATKPKKGKVVKDKKNTYDWDDLRKQAQVNGHKKERTPNTRDSIDWEAVMRADVSVISETIKERGMNNMLAERIKDLLDRLVKDHGSIDLEWLRDIPPDKAKEYLLSFRGLGLKSVECVRLLTLHHLAFPVDTNVGRIAVRLGWVPLQPLPEQLQLHLLELYPVLESIQKYLWPRLCKLDQKTLYELHYHMITFGKVFCTKRQPNCNACPLRGECRHFASAFASARLALPGPEEKRIVPSVGGSSTHVNSQASIDPLPLPLWSNHYTEENLRCDKGAPTVEVPSTPLSLPLPQPINHFERNSQISSEPIVEIPASPEPEPVPEQERILCDIEDAFYEDPNEIPTIELNMKEFTQTLQNFMEANRELQETGMSRALVALTPEIASIPTPKLKNISRLRTEHHVYELPDTHPLLKGMDKREPDDPCSYLLAIWTPGETADSIQPPERRCNFDDPSILCNEETCSYCSSQREANSQIVRGTLLIPCRTAMRGSFPLNGTYFQVNEVFADHDSSLKPIDVPRSWLWNLPRRTVYFGTSVPTIFRGLNTEDIQHCFWRGYVCVRGFDQRTRAPRPLMARLHFPASRMPRGGKGKTYDDE